MIASKVLLKTYTAASRNGSADSSNAERADITIDDELSNLCEKVCAL